jgi:5-methylcytosine-specific restriction endonuclease McrA
MAQDLYSESLASSVLVLNRNYAAIHVVNVRRAFSLLVRELAEVIHLEDEGRFSNYNFDSWREIGALREEFESDPHDDWIQAVNFRIQVPRIIRLLVFERLPRHTVRFNRRNVFARDGNRCQYCGKKFPTCELSLDHVIPRSQGGDTTWENIVCACVRCNVRKGGRTPKEAGLHLIAPAKKPARSPVLSLKLGNPKYASWKTFLSDAYWSVDLR